MNILTLFAHIEQIINKHSLTPFNIRDISCKLTKGFEEGETILNFRFSTGRDDIIYSTQLNCSDYNTELFINKLEIILIEMHAEYLRVIRSRQE